METNTMDILYTAKVTASRGRHGSIRSDDGLLGLNLALPKALGGNGGATNPEQLFVGGYAACFENALLRIGREAERRFADQDIQVTEEIGLSKNPSDAFMLPMRSRRLPGSRIITTALLHHRTTSLVGASRSMGCNRD
jgi:Ohr subfamily peroxiredoxin